MIECVARLIDPAHGEYAVGYERQPGQFVPLVAGIYTPEAAQREADRLNAQARGRQTDAFVDNTLRGTAHGWRTEMP